MVPCGPVLGCHMAPVHWLFGKHFMGSIGVEPMTSRLGREVWQGWATIPPTCCWVGKVENGPECLGNVTISIH
jgi:hypothetical protein